jgi:serine protease Do
VLEKFVCVRLVHMNGLDLKLFQFDYDLSWTAIMMNADQTIYGRYGTRNSKEKGGATVSLPGFRKALEGALELHSKHAEVKTALAAKTGPAPKFPTAEKYPQLSRYAPILSSNTHQSCIHCHKMYDALRDVDRAQGKPVTDFLVRPYPMPDVIGLSMDVNERARIKNVLPTSIAERAGFRANDDIIAMDGQPIISIADVQWVLQHAPEPSQVKAVVMRNSQKINLTLQIEKGWRNASDVSWRTQTWAMARLFLGMRLEQVTDDELTKLGIKKENMALRVSFIWNDAQNGYASAAGFKKGDVVTSFNGVTAKQSENELQIYVAQQTSRGQKVPVTLMRDGKSLELLLPVK